MLPAGAARADQPPAHADAFPCPAGLEPQVRFWRGIFAETSIHQVVLHDALHLDKVYKVLDFRPELEDGVSPAEVDRLQRIETDLELERIRATLLRLHALGPNAEGLTAEERAIPSAKASASRGATCPRWSASSARKGCRSS